MGHTRNEKSGIPFIERSFLILFKDQKGPRNMGADLYNLAFLVFLLDIFKFFPKRFQPPAVSNSGTLKMKGFESS